MSAGELMAELLELSDRIRPVSLIAERTLPVPGLLGEVLPGAGLRRGSVVAVEGAGTTSVLVEFLAAATRAGEWAALVDDLTVSVPALVEAGAVLDRLAVVHRVPASRRSTVVNALLEGMGLVAVGPRFRPTHRDLRRLTARAREQGSVLVVTGPGVERAALRLRLRGSQWRWEHGRLGGRELLVEVEDRGRASRHRIRAA